MSEVNLYYCKKDNSWWTNSSLDGFSLMNYIKEYPIGLGTIQISNVEEINFNRVHNAFIPDYIKKFMGVSIEIETNGFENAQRVTLEELKEKLK